MWGKKGDWALPIYIIPSLAALIIILFIFGIMFFSIGIKQNPNLKISPEAYQDSSKILTILRSPVEAQQLTLAELVSLSLKDQSYKEELEKELQFLLNKLPKPKDNSEWIISIEVEDSEFMNVGATALLRREYLEQLAVIPLEDKKTAKVKLYLECLACSQEEINAII